MTPNIFTGLTVAAVISTTAAAAAFGIANSWVPTKTAERILFPDLLDRYNDIGALVIETHGNLLTVRRTETGWGLEQRDLYPVVTRQVRETLIGLARLKLQEKKTHNPTRHHLLELQAPATEGSASRQITVLADDGATLASVVLGKTRYGMFGSQRDGLYLRQPQDNQTWLAAGDVRVSAEVRDWIETDLLDLSKDRVRQAVIMHPDGNALIVEQEKDVLTLADLHPQETLKDQNDLNYLVTSLARVTAQDLRKNLGETSQSGLEARIETRDGLILEYRLAKEDDSHWLAITATVADDAKDTVKKESEAINGRTDGWYFKIPAYKVTAISKKRSDFIEMKAAG